MSAERSREDSLGSRVTTAAAWMVAFRWVDRLVGLVSVAILARLLAPDDFGVVGYALLVSGILELFTGLSTDAELIRRAHATRAHYDAAWTMNALRGLAISMLMLALALPAADFFREARLGPIMGILAAIPLVQGFENVGIVDFRKRLEFHREFRFLLTTRLIGTAVTIALAFALRTYWALVAGAIVRAAFRVALSYRVHPFRPRFELSRVAEMFRFSRWMMIQNLASGLNERMPGFVIGREWDSSALAFFNLGRELAELSSTEIRAPIRRALYPGLAQIVERRARLAEVLVRSSGVLALVTLPIPLGMALVADDVVPLVLGPQWLPTIALLQPLCIAGAISALGTNSQLAYMVLDRSHLAAIAVSVRMLLLLGLLLVISPRFGVVGVAYAIASVTCLMTIVDYAIAPRLLGIERRRFLAVVWRPIVAALAMAAGVWILRFVLPPPSDVTGHAWSLFLTVVLGAIVYLTCLLALWRFGGRRDGPEQWVIRLVKERYARHLRSAA